ncbi:hypothetical protein [Flavobacterium sp. JP2137]|uniref:hypothetical protein n=1 Tax=Flavobacterium sp. JP2137 TaxID=3414510 RepID=UPI003D2FB714
MMKFLGAIPQTGPAKERCAQRDKKTAAGAKPLFCEVTFCEKYFNCLSIVYICKK